MKRFLILIGLLPMTGCVTVSEVQGSCEQQHQAFSDVVRCVDYSFRDDPRAAGNQNYKLYIMQGYQLANMVSNGQISDYDARVQWQQHYLEFKRVADAQSAAAFSAAAALSSPTGSYATPRSTQGGVTCFKKNEWVSGFNKNCVYNCLGSDAVYTISNTGICPSSIVR